MFGGVQKRTVSRSSIEQRKETRAGQDKVHELWKELVYKIGKEVMDKRGICHCTSLDILCIVASHGLGLLPCNSCPTYRCSFHPPLLFSALCIGCASFLNSSTTCMPPLQGLALVELFHLPDVFCFFRWINPCCPHVLLQSLFSVSVIPLVFVAS